MKRRNCSGVRTDRLGTVGDDVLAHVGLIQDLHQTDRNSLPGSSLYGDAI
jgi:hypothetical protein